MEEKIPPKEVEAPPRKPEIVDSDKPPERWVSLFGFVIVTKSDLLAAAAFLLSLITVVYQFSSWVRGPAPSVYPPDVMYVFFDQYANNRTIVRFAAQLSFVNTAEAGHDAIVRDITLQESAKDDLSIKQQWLSFVTIQRDRTRLMVVPKEAAHPFPIIAGGAMSNTVSFAPLEQACLRSVNGSPKAPIAVACDSDQYFVTDIDFLNKIADIDALTLQFSARIVGSGRPLVTSCTLPVGVALRQYLAENEWFAASGANLTLGARA